MACGLSGWRYDAPYTFVVVSLLMLLFGIGTCIEAPKDIYPYINIPVVTIVWSYSGLPPEEMEGRIVTVCERALTTTVNDIEHTQSESYQGVSVIRVFFQLGGQGGTRDGPDHGDRPNGFAGIAARNLLFEQQLLETIYGVSRLYYDLVSLGENIGVKEESLAAAQKLFDDDKSQVDEGTLAPSS